MSDGFSFVSDRVVVRTCLSKSQYRDLQEAAKILKMPIRDVVAKAILAEIETAFELDWLEKNPNYLQQNKT